MKRLMHVFLAITLLLGLSGCGGIKQEEYDAILSEKAELENQLEAYEPYQSIVEALQSEEYDSAIDEISAMKTEKIIREAGNIEDYLVKVEINEDNFEDYFEFADYLSLNAFGEPSIIFHGLVSKVYDEGLIIYDFGGISVEYSYSDGRNTNVYGLERMLIFPSGEEPEYASSWKWTGRIVPGTVTFLKSEYVDSIEIREPETPDQGFAWCQFTLKNGETFGRSIRVNYTY